MRRPARLSFQLERRDGLDLDRSPDESRRLLAEEHGAGDGGLLEARRHVDGIAGRETLLRARDDLPGIDPDASLDAELGQCREYLGRRADGAQRVILVEHRNPEHGHHRVADELLHRPAVPLDDRLDPLEVAVEDRAERLGVDRFPERGRAGDVAEDHRDDLALLARCRRLG